MLTIVINLLTFVLILVSLFMLLVILMQRANSNAGMGSAFGGGVTESTFGAETTNILERATKWSALAFFIIALVLYLLFMAREGASSQKSDADLPVIPVVEEAAPAATEPTISTTPSPDAASAQTGETLDQVAAEAEAVLDAETQEAAETVITETVPAAENQPTP